LTISPPLPPRYVLNTCIQTTVYPGLDKETEDAAHECRVVSCRGYLHRPARRFPTLTLHHHDQLSSGLVFRPTLPGSEVGPDMHDLQTTCIYLATTICRLLVSGISANTCLICCLQARPVASRTRLQHQGLGCGWLQIGLVVTSRLAPHRFFVRPSLLC
jgi:hypothetical protein